MLGSLALTLLAMSALPQDEPAQPLREPLALQPAKGRVDQPIELGQVRWRRDYEKALAEAEQANKPVLLLFQEVPG